ncbi:DUF3823 domain-containing protein [Neolewinella sp.]|uniref:DUF3823 domain-containing protein n=1 Tax=Neolewinella sp. TaxID=2993543 RepID=UPI003B52F034
MRSILQFLPLILLTTLVLACEEDNFAEPTTSLTGRLVYQGEPINVEYNRVSYELYQDGFGKVGPIGSTFTSEGEFSHLLFNGEYKMIIPIGQGPFLPLQNQSGQPDTIRIDLRGNEVMDIEVTPYWRIQNALISAGEDRVGATVSLEQIVTGDQAKDIESVTLYVSKTAFANTQTNVATAAMGGGDIADMNSISLSVDIPEIQPVQNYVFASVGVKFAGVEDLLFSDTERLDF